MPVYKSVSECRYRSIRKLETRHVNLKPTERSEGGFKFTCRVSNLRSVGFKFTCRVSNFRIDLASILHNMSLVVRKSAFCICENKGADQLRGNREADQRLCFRYTNSTIVQFLYFLNPKFQASSHRLWLYSPVCVGPGRKPRRPVFSQRGSYETSTETDIKICNSEPQHNQRLGSVGYYLRRGLNRFDGSHLTPCFGSCTFFGAHCCVLLASPMWLC